MLRRKKKIILDTHARVDKAQLKVNSAFIMFQQAHDALEEVDIELNETLAESEKRLASLQGQLENEKFAMAKAVDQQNANNKLKQQLQPFLS